MGKTSSSCSTSRPHNAKCLQLMTLSMKRSSISTLTLSSLTLQRTSSACYAVKLRISKRLKSHSPHSGTPRIPSCATLCTRHCAHTFVRIPACASRRAHHPVHNSFCTFLDDLAVSARTWFLSCAYLRTCARA